MVRNCVFNRSFLCYSPINFFIIHVGKVGLIFIAILHYFEKTIQLVVFLQRDVFFTVFILLISFIGSVVVINVMQQSIPNHLPTVLRTWKFLPEFLRSLKPYDKLISKYLCFMNCCKKLRTSDQENNEKYDFATVLHSNKAFENETF